MKALGARSPIDSFEPKASDSFSHTASTDDHASAKSGCKTISGCNPSRTITRQPSPVKVCSAGGSVISMLPLVRPADLILHMPRYIVRLCLFAIRHPT